MPLSLSVLSTLHKMVARINSAKQEFLRFWVVPVDHNSFAKVQLQWEIRNLNLKCHGICNFTRPFDHGRCSFFLIIFFPSPAQRQIQSIIKKMGISSQLFTQKEVNNGIYIFLFNYSNLVSHVFSFFTFSLQLIWHQWKWLSANWLISFGHTLIVFMALLS